jgi:DNA-binding NarL/FixJ family response regulator
MLIAKPVPHTPRRQGEIRVLLAVDFPLLSDLLKALLGDEPEVEIVGEVADPADLLLATGQTEADVIIQCWQSSEQVPGICTHLLAAYPDVLVIGLGADGEHNYTCRRPVVVDSLSTPALSGVQAAIREALSGTPLALSLQGGT